MKIRQDCELRLRLRVGRILALAFALWVGGAGGVAWATATVGDLSPHGTSCNSGLMTGVSSPPYVMPSAGTVTALSLQGDAAGSGAAIAEVFRLIGGRTYAVVGQSPTATFTRPNQTIQFTDLHIPVDAGDFLGLWVSAPYDCASASSASDTGFVSYSPGGPGNPGQSLIVNANTFGSRYSVAAQFEPNPSPTASPTAVPSATATPPATATPIPTIGPLPPEFTITSARLEGRFLRSHLATTARIVLSGRTDRPLVQSVSLLGPQRPSGKPATASLGAHRIPVGTFSFVIRLAKGLAARLLPGRFTIRMSSPATSAEARVVVPSPLEGVVVAHRISTSRAGPNLLSVTRTTQLWASFRFAAGATSRRRLRVRWYAPDNSKPIGAFPVAGNAPFSYWRDHRGLAEGRWRCVLIAGAATVDAVSIRVG